MTLSYRKTQLKKCLLISAKIRHLKIMNLFKSKEKKNEGEKTKFSSNELTIKLQTLQKEYENSCFEVQSGLHFMRVALNVFSELFARPSFEHNQENVEDEVQKEEEIETDKEQTVEDKEQSVEDKKQSVEDQLDQVDDKQEQENKNKEAKKP